jgi:hypothetical protein
MRIDEELMRENVACGKKTDLLRSVTSVEGFRTPNEHSALELLTN